GHQLAISIPPEPLTLQADAVRVAQIFANLLNNAAKYTDAGGQIWLIARQEGSEVIVSVRDTGIGIAAEKLPQVFDMFAQIQSGGRRSKPGLGIGLTLVKRLVELHGGRVEASSAGLGCGSEFVVRLPLARAAAERPARQPPRVERAAPLAKRRILV